MKMQPRWYQTLCIVTLCLLTTATASAQLLIKPDGRVTLGPNTRPFDDLHQVLSASIQGTRGEYNAGAKLGFGDFGRRENNGWNVFVGEWGEYDSDMLWLHAKNGIRVTTLDGRYMVMAWGARDGFLPRLIVHDGLQLDRLSVSSDDHRKKNIAPIKDPLARLLSLNGIRYCYVPIDNQSEPAGADSPVDPSDKEAAAAAVAEGIRTLRNSGDVRYGLIAQEVAQVFPELVEEDEAGNQYVNYLEFIPVLVSALQELAEHRGAPAFFPQNMESRGDSTATDSATDRLLGANGRTAAPILYQNTPNPFSNSTEIEYNIPPSATTAAIYIFNLNGLLLQTHPITFFGHGSIEILASTLVAGMYLYTLVVDGQIVDTKRMILTE